MPGKFPRGRELTRALNNAYGASLSERLQDEKLISYLGETQKLTSLQKHKKAQHKRYAKAASPSRYQAKLEHAVRTALWYSDYNISAQKRNIIDPTNLEGLTPNPTKNAFTSLYTYTNNALRTTCEDIYKSRIKIVDDIWHLKIVQDIVYQVLHRCIYDVTLAAATFHGTSIQQSRVFTKAFSEQIIYLNVGLGAQIINLEIEDYKKKKRNLDDDVIRETFFALRRIQTEYFENHDTLKDKAALNCRDRTSTAMQKHYRDNYAKDTVSSKNIPTAPRSSIHKIYSRLSLTLFRKETDDEREIGHKFTVTLRTPYQTILERTDDALTYQVYALSLMHPPAMHTIDGYGIYHEAALRYGKGQTVHIQHLVYANAIRKFYREYIPTAKPHYLALLNQLGEQHWRLNLGWVETAAVDIDKRIKQIRLEMAELRDLYPRLSSKQIKALPSQPERDRYMAHIALRRAIAIKYRMLCRDRTQLEHTLLWVKRFNPADKHGYVSIYIGWFYDTRSRFYPVDGSAPRMHGTKLDKSAIHLPNRVKLTALGRYHLNIQIARAHNSVIEKWSEQEAIEYFNQHKKNYIEAAFNNAPTDRFEDEHTLLSLVRDAYKPDGTIRPSSTKTIPVDATSSGAQILGGLSRCRKTLALCGIGDTADPNQSLYVQVGQYVQAHLTDYLNGQLPISETMRTDPINLTVLNQIHAARDSETGIPLLQHKLACKRASMVYFYSASQRAMGRYIFEGCQELLETRHFGAISDEYKTKPFRLPAPAYYLLAELTRRALQQYAPGAVMLFEWIKSLGTLYVQHKIPYLTFPELELPLAIGYRKLKKKDYDFINPNPDTMPNYGKIKSAIAPSTVHNIDATIASRHCRYMMNKGIQILPIHDSFATHPNYRDLNQRNLLRTYRSVIESDPLQVHYEKALELLPAEVVPPIPQLPDDLRISKREWQALSSREVKYPYAFN